MVILQKKLMQNNSGNKILNAPVNKIIPQLAIPSIMCMVSSALYNIVDTYFVSKLGQSATGAIGVVLSASAIIQASGFWVGMGAASNISRFLGRNHIAKANITATSAILLSCFFGILIMLFGIIFNPFLMNISGATPTILPYAVKYSKILFFGAPFMCMSFTLNNLLRAQGKAKLSLVGIVSGCLINIFLDPIFIFTLNLGIYGAGLSTVLCQLISFVIMFKFIRSPKAQVKISLKRFKFIPKLYLLILVTGLPSLFRQLLSALATVTLNRSASVFGDSAVAAMAIANRINFMVGSMVAGFGQGFQPVCGFAYGAQNYQRVKQAFKFSLKVCTCILLICSFVCLCFSREIVANFVKDNNPHIIEIGSLTLRFLGYSMSFSAIVILTNMLLQVCGKSFMAILTSMSRQGLFFIPLVMILPNFMGITGLAISQSLADIFASIFCLGACIKFFRSLKQ